MKKILFALLLVALSLTIALPAFAMGEEPCTHDGTSIQALHDCVVHAIEMGHVSQAIGNALLKQVDGAQVQINAEQAGAAVKTLNAFIRTVKALPAGQIDPAHADCLVMHAEMVIEGLQ